MLDNLGDQALEFSVRVYLADINRSLQAQTELRTAIFKALRAEGIDMPYASALAGHAHDRRRRGSSAPASTIGVPARLRPEAVQDALAEAARRSGLEADGEDALRSCSRISATPRCSFSVRARLPTAWHR